MWIHRWIIAVLGGSLSLVASVRAQTNTTQHPLIVGTKQAPPFAMKQADGTWRGISIELWRALAAELQVTYELRERDWQGLLDGVAVGVLIWFFERKRNPLLPDVFEHQTYGFALPSNSPLREDLNRVLLGQLQQPTWQDILYRYLGKPSDQATVP